MDVITPLPPFLHLNTGINSPTMALPTTAAVEGGQRPQGRQQQQHGGFGQTIIGINRMAVFLFFAFKFFSAKRPTEPAALTSNFFQKGELLSVFMEGNHYLLAIIMLVSLLHSVFDFLAFGNDVQFWNKNKSMERLSAKSAVVSFISQLVVFIYVLDNDTSWMILESSVIGCIIEFWKIGKAMNIEIDRTGRIPMLKFREQELYARNMTKEYDDIAMKYLSYVMFFLAACFSVYSLKYEHHMSWYSWILSSLTSCVYVSGFIMICSHLFINYKLKSIAHLPWRQMTYKFLNTVSGGDLFALVIKMPTLHQSSVSRDVNKRLANKIEENRILMLRPKKQHEEQKQETDMQEQFYQDEIKSIHESMNVEVEDFERMEQLREYEMAEQLQDRMARLQDQRARLHELIRAKEAEQRARRQQLRVREEKLRARRQDLIARGEILRARRHDLKAREQNLSARYQDLRAKEQNLR